MREVRLIKSFSSMSGRQFAPVSELDLHSLAVDVAASLQGPSGDVWVIPEMPSPLGLPDFVALLGGEDWLAARSRVATGPVLSEADCVVLASLHVARPSSSETVMRKLNWDADRLAPVVSRLVRSGAVLRSASGALTLTPGMLPQGRLVAIETKVKDWGRAIQQGRAYRTWSDNYVVVLGDVGQLALNRARIEVAADRAGLYAGADWIVRPAARKATLSRRLQGFEYVYASVTSDPAFGISE